MSFAAVEFAAHSARRHAIRAARPVTDDRDLQLAVAVTIARRWQ